jgi:hypothetical protein
VELLTNGNTVDYIQAFIDTNTYLASTPSPPSVMSTSYGIDEDEFSLSDAQFVARSEVYHGFDHQSSTGFSALATWLLALAASR